MNYLTNLTNTYFPSPTSWRVNGIEMWHRNTVLDGETTATFFSRGDRIGYCEGNGILFTQDTGASRPETV